MPEDKDGVFRLRDARAVPPGWPADVAPNQIIFAQHINDIRDSVYSWPGDVDGGNHTLSNVHLVNPTGVMVDPTTAPGDLIARDATAPARLPVSATAGQVLTADPTAAQKMKWATPIGAVASVFGRTGAVTAQPHDYTAAMVDNAVDSTKTYANPAWLTSIAWGVVTGAPATFPPAAHTHDAAEIVSGRLNTARLGSGIADATVYLRGDGTWAPVTGGSGGGGAVISVFGRAGVVVAQPHDYSVDMVDGAAPDKTLQKGDLLVRDSLSINRLPSGANGQVLTSDNTQQLGMAWKTFTAGGGMADPTTTFGDLIVRGPGAPDRLALGANGLVLTADSASPLGVKWASASASGLTDPTTTKGDLLVRDTSAVRRIGVGLNGQILMADSSTALGVRWADPTGAQTPWTQDVDAAGFKLVNAGKVGIGVYPTNILDMYASGYAPVVQVMGDSAQDYMNCMFQGASYSGTKANLGLIIRARSCRGTSAAPTPTQGGDYLFSIGGEGCSTAGAQTYGGAAQIVATAASTWTASNQETLMYLQITPNASVNAAARLYVTGTGVSVGTSVSVPARPFHVFGKAGDGWSVFIDPNSYGTGAAPGLALGLANNNAAIQTFGSSQVLCLNPNGGNVSIGTNADYSQKLYVNGNIQSAAWVLATLAQVSSDGAGYFRATAYSGLTRLMSIGNGTGGEIAIQREAGYIGNTSIWDGNTNQIMFIGGSSQCVGIRTGAPQGPLHVAAKGSIFGTPAGSTTAPATTDANIMLYYADAGNWAGIGADSNGNMWFRTATSGAPNPRMVITASGQVCIAAPTAINGALIQNSQVTFWLNEGANQLTFTVKYSNGTQKQGVVALS